MTIRHRKSAALAIDGQPQSGLLASPDAAVDIDDINIWLADYLEEHGAAGLAIRADTTRHDTTRHDTTFSQAGLDVATCKILLAAFEHRYSVHIASRNADCLSSAKACAELLLTQFTAAAAVDQETASYQNTRHMVRALTSPR